MYCQRIVYEFFVLMLFAWKSKKQPVSGTQIGGLLFMTEPTSE